VVLANTGSIQTTMIKFVHVGIQKTGSKWLQYGLFNQHPQLEVFGHIVKHHRLEKPGYLVRELYNKYADDPKKLREVLEQILLNKF